MFKVLGLTALLVMGSCSSFHSDKSGKSCDRSQKSCCAKKKKDCKDSKKCEGKTCDRKSKKAKKKS
ncbi:hypothetical protein [Halobacteriovorax sp. RZ-2]|uniref:hypothetical protein n=1 Tax=unclassified Halobacteriovorax TaxID=2639665 RepID=UPI00371FFDEC